jgi:phosphatidylglycerophosphate synthase
LIDVAVILLWADDRVPLALVVIVLARDILLLFSLLFGRGRHLGIRVNVVGKAGTLVTMIGLLLAIVTPPGSVATQIVLWSGVALLVIGGFVYVRTLRRLRA